MDENNKLMIPKKAKNVLIVILVAVIVCAAVAGSIYYKGYVSQKEKYEAEIAEYKKKIDEMSNPIAPYIAEDKTVSLAIIESQINEIGELATMEYIYTDAGKFEDPHKLFGLKIPFTEKSFIAKWDGVIKAGIKVDNIDVSLDNEHKLITISLPQAEILSHDIDEKNIQTLDQTDGLFNPVKIEDVREFDAINRESMEKRAIENGLLEKAFDRAKNMITEVLQANPTIAEEYKIDFKTV